MTSPATQEPCPKCGKPIPSGKPGWYCEGLACSSLARPSQRAELLTREQLDPAAVMLRTGMAALEHARDLRVKVGVSELQAAALLQHIAALQSQLDTAQKDNLARHRQCGELRTKVAALTQRVEAQERELAVSARTLDNAYTAMLNPASHNLEHMAEYCRQQVNAIRALSQEPRDE